MEYEDDYSVTEEQKNACAVTCMRCMLEDYSRLMNHSFEEELKNFLASDTYDALFDFSTGLWREGPRYIMDWYLTNH